MIPFSITYALISNSSSLFMSSMKEQSEQQQSTLTAQIHKFRIQHKSANFK